MNASEIPDSLPLIEQVNFLNMEVCRFIDEGKKIPIDKFVDLMDNHEIVIYLRKEYGFINVNCKEKYQDKIQQALNDIYVSENNANNLGIKNNGLVYLSRILFEMLHAQMYEYKWVARELANEQNKKGGQ